MFSSIAVICLKMQILFLQKLFNASFNTNFCRISTEKHSATCQICQSLRFSFRHYKVLPNEQLSVIQHESAKAERYKNLSETNSNAF